MKHGDKLEILQFYGGGTMLIFVAGDGQSSKTFSLGDATEALKYLLLDDIGRNRKDGKHE